MTDLPWVILLYTPFVHASLLPMVLNGTTISTLDTCNASTTSGQRTLWDIVWSCGVTLFAWTWTAIHPNIPGQEDSKAAIIGRRLFLMTWALFVPEFFVTWAALQYFSARETRQKFNVNILRTTRTGATISERLSMMSEPSSWQSNGIEEWTMKHGFFAWMGGFVLKVGDEYVTLTPDELMRYIREGNVEIPKILDVEIADRSKRDGLSKAFATVQLAWFVLQFVARYFQNLQATLLEVDTLSIAAMTCIAQFFWWDKPMNIGRPYIIYWKAETGSPPSLNDLFYGKEDKARSCAHYLFRPILSLAGVKYSNSRRANKGRRVSSVGGYGKHHYSVITILIGCLCGMFYGALHCLGWKYLFQTRSWVLLWRGSSVVVIISSMMFLLGFGYYELWSRNDKSKNRSRIVLADVFLIFLCSLLPLTVVMYVLGRALVNILTILSLLVLPPSAYDTVNWTEFFPHL